MSLNFLIKMKISNYSNHIDHSALELPKILKPIND